MEVMEGATPKGLEEAGVGETPLLEMVLPGVTAIPGAGDEPGSQKRGRGLGCQNEGTTTNNDIRRILSHWDDFNSSYNELPGT